MPSPLWYPAGVIDLLAPVLILIAALLYAAFLCRGAVMRYRQWVREVRIRVGCCGRCGYDLRMTPLRCPECGEVPDPAERARVAMSGARKLGLWQYVRDSLVPPGPRPVRFGCFTERARRVVGLACNAAGRTGGPVASRHLLAAVAADGKGSGAALLRQMGVDLAGVVQQIAPGFAGDEAIELDQVIGEEARVLLYSATAEAEFLSEEQVGTEHLVLAMLARPGTVDAAQFLPPSLTHEAAMKALLGLRRANGDMGTKTQRPMT